MLGGEPAVPHAEGEDFPCIPIRRAGFHVKIGAGIEMPLVTLDMEDGLGVEVGLERWFVRDEDGASCMRRKFDGDDARACPARNAFVVLVQVAAHDTECPSIRVNHSAGSEVAPAHESSSINVLGGKNEALAGIDHVAKTQLGPVQVPLKVSSF